jgi:hypothetical protein
MAANPSNKRAMIDKANSTVVIVSGVAAFIFVFSLVATKTLVSQSAYQNRVIDAKRQTLKQLKTDITAAKQLQTSYQQFTSTSQNVLGGNPTGNGPQDGDNTKIVLDALPSTYDFPALVTSIEAMLNGQQVTTNGISGTDDEAAQSTNTTSATPQSVAMPFELTVSGNYSSIQGLISTLEHSIRPIQVQKLDVNGNQDKLTLTLSAQSFYQPAKSLNITTKVVQ